MKAASVLLLMSLSPCAYGHFAFDGHTTGSHTFQGQGTWQDKDGTKGAYLVQMQIQHDGAEQAVVTTTYLVQDKTYAMTGMVVKDSSNSNFLTISAAGDKTGEGYCYKIARRGDDAAVCHLECTHSKTKFEGSFMALKNKIERIGSLVLPSGKKLILRDSLKLVPNTTGFSIEGSGMIKGDDQGEPLPLPAGMQDASLAGDDLQQGVDDNLDIKQQGPVDTKGGKEPTDTKGQAGGKDAGMDFQGPSDDLNAGVNPAMMGTNNLDPMNSVDPFAGELPHARPAPREEGGLGDKGQQGPIAQQDDLPLPAPVQQGGKGQIAQGPVAQGPVAQGPVAQGPVAQGPVAQAPAVKGGKDLMGSGAGAYERRYVEARRSSNPSTSESYREQIRRQLRAQQDYLRSHR